MSFPAPNVVPTVVNMAKGLQRHEMQLNEQTPVQPDKESRGRKTKTGSLVVLGKMFPRTEMLLSSNQEGHSPRNSEPGLPGAKLLADPPWSLWAP